MELKYKFEEGKFTEGPNGRINYSLSFPNVEKTAYNGPLVICFHGLLSSISSFKKLETECLKTGLAVLRIDMPGHGLSSWSYFGSLTSDDFINQVDTVLINLGLEKLFLYLVGISMGGLMTLYYAGAHPEKVLKVASLCPACFCRPLSTLQKMVVKNIPGVFRFFENSLPLYLFVTRDGILDDYYDPEKINPEAIDLRYFRHRYYGRQLRSTFGRVVTGFDFWENDQALKVFMDKYISIRGVTGVCFFLGLHDEMVPTDIIIPKLKNTIPKARAIIYQNCKHQLLEEGNNIINDIVNYFYSNSESEYCKIGLAIDSIRIQDNVQK
ncbi:aminopeptidase [Cryptosporidium ubiquitum]|uniref:Aminopeptidase n=1 Tax=Cryptosporidium ubiquitum TaxID=857276 RepID=A0A1J4M9U5_9CRYT|nr:aminopeptidase [Cryptosporidium ubiquitum]OII70986.1 aminopeptidase [Cryptosporidium ubiquitum]